MQFEDKDFPHQYGSRDKQPVPSTSSSSPFTVPPSTRPTELHSRDKPIAASVNTSGGGSHRYTNHDRMKTQQPPPQAQPSATATLSTVGGESAIKTAAALFNDEADRLQAAAAATAGVSHGQFPLRRIKTESATLSMSAKQYFQRKERERLERDAAAAKTELKPANKEGDDVKIRQEPSSKSSPPHAKAVSNADVHESDVEKAEQQNKWVGSEFVRKTTEVKPTIRIGDLKSVLIQNVSTAFRAHQNPPPLTTNRGMGDPFDQRPANIFESFRINESQQESQGSLEFTAITTSTQTLAASADHTAAVSAADSLDLGAILKPEHVHGGDYSLEMPVFTSATTVPTAAVVSSVQSASSSLSVSHGGHRAATHAGAFGSVASDRSRQRSHGDHSHERRRSARHEGSTSLTSPTKLLRPADQMTALSDSRKHEHETNRRRRPSNSSQPSPLKMKLSFLPSTSQTGSPTIVKQAQSVDTPSKLRPHVASPMLDSGTAALAPDSQEHIRLKVNISSGRVEKVGNAGTTTASPGAAAVASSRMKLVLSKDKVSGEYQHGSSSSSAEGGSQHHRHYRRHHHGHHHHRHKHLRPDADPAAAAHPATTGHVTMFRKRPADSVDSTAKLPSQMEKKLRSELLGNGGGGHQSVAARRFSQAYMSQTNNVATSTAGLSRTHIPSTYRMTGVPPPPPPLPLSLIHISEPTRPY